MAKLLFIDDDPEIRRLFVPFLRERSHTVTACENGLQAMLLLQKDFHFDVIICDYCMPIKTGGEVWNLVRKLPRNSFRAFYLSNSGRSARI